MGAQYGNSKRHLLRKLKRAHREDLVGAVQRGEVTTYQAAVEAGIRKRRRPLEFDTSVAKRREFRRHPDRARHDAECPAPASAFESVERAHRYWFENRARLMPILAVDGRRPWGWWAFEAGLCHPGRDLERSTLFEAGLLGAEEEAELLRDWRHESSARTGPISSMRAAGRSFVPPPRVAPTMRGATYRARCSSSGRSSAGAARAPSAGCVRAPEREGPRSGAEEVGDR
jgi:hypothetical protein